MSIVSALKQFHAENLGKSTLIIIAAVFAGMTYGIYQTIDGILANDPKRQPAEAGSPAAAALTPPAAAEAPAAVPAQLSTAPGSILPAAAPAAQSVAAESVTPAAARP